MTRITDFVVTLVAACCLATSGVRAKILDDVVHIIAKELSFFSEDYSSINVDGLFGLRLGQGQLQDTVKLCDKKPCGDSLKKTLQTLESELDKACDSALPYVEQADPDYYERFLATINAPYMNPYTPAKFTLEPEYQGKNSDYDEDRGDACYARMLGTYTENNTTLPRCNITDDCWAYMTKTGTSGYFITHQLLYFIMVNQVGCKSSLDKYLKGQSLFNIQEDFCHKIYSESEQLVKAGQVSSRRKDLFLEQTVLCGPLGFVDFMREDWMKMVLGWPNKNLGCFRASYMDQLENTVLGSIGKKLDEYNEESASQKTEQLSGLGKLLKKIGRRETITGEGTHSSMRKLLREKSMKDGCLSHTSGLGFGVFCTYLRFLVEQM